MHVCEIAAKYGGGGGQRDMARMQENFFAAWAPPRTPLGELTALFQTSWLDLRGGEKGREGKEKERGEGKGPSVALSSPVSSGL